MPALREIEVKQVDENKKKSQDGIQSRWWNQERDHVHESVFGVIASIQRNQALHVTNLLKFAQMYSNQEIMGLSPWLYGKGTPINLINPNRLRLNVCKSMVDTLTSKISKNNPVPKVLTDGADYDEQMLGENLTKYIKGVFEQCQAYEKGEMVFRDSLIFADGFLKIYCDYERGKIDCERVMPIDIIVDFADGANGNPTQLHQWKFYSRDVLLDMFPKYKEEIMAISSGVVGQEANEHAGDLVVVVESWHLRSGLTAGDGRHVISVENATLFYEDYDKDYFPFVKIEWSKRPMGYFSIGLIEELVGIQVEINKLLRTIQLAQYFQGIPRTWVPMGSVINTQHINNDIGAIIEFDNQPPIFSTPSAIAPEYYNHLRFLLQEAYNITGVSQMSANSTEPQKLESGRAIETMLNIETDRFASTAKRYEQFYIKVAKIMIDMSKDLFLYNKDLKVQVSTKENGKSFVETIKWKDVDLEADVFTLDLYPVSQLPQTPEGKLDYVQQLAQAGYLPPDQAMDLLDIADTEVYVSLDVANLRATRYLIGCIIKEDKYYPPQQYMNLQEAQKLAQGAYLIGLTNNMPLGRMNKLVQFIDDCHDMMALAQPPIAPGSAPQGQPAQPPVSDLQPFQGS